MTTMDAAWAMFDEAVKWEEKATTPGKDGLPKSDKMKEMALRQADKKLEEAIALERQALEGQEAKAA